MAAVLYDLLIGIAGSLSEGRISEDSYWKPGAIENAIKALEILDADKAAQIREYYP